MKRFLKCITALVRGPEVTHTCGNAKCVNPDHTRLVFGAMLALSVLAAPMAANAEWFEKELRWHKSSVGSPYSGTAIFTRDTSFNVVGGNATTSGPLDTTATFSLSDAHPVYYGAATTVATGRDSMVAGYIAFQSDSAVVPTGAMSSISLILEGKQGPMSWPNTSLAGWTPIDSLTALMVDGDLGVVIPIPCKGGGKITTRPGLSPFGFSQLRARVVASVGALPSCRVFLRYWKP